jgi:uncharacterized membrane protein
LGEYFSPYLDTFSGMMDTLSDPQRMHAMIVHLPIAVALMGLLGVFVLVVTGGTFKWMPWVLAVLYLVGMFSAWYASETGEGAEEALASRSVMPYPEEVDNDLREHAKLGEWLWVAMAATAVATMLVAAKANVVCLPGLLLSALLAFGTVGYVGLIAHHGGALVYVHGVGAPHTNYNTLGPPPDPAADPPTAADLKNLENNTTPKTGKTGTGAANTGGAETANKQGTKRPTTNKTNNPQTTEKPPSRTDPPPDLPGGRTKSIFD